MPIQRAGFGNIRRLEDFVAIVILDAELHEVVVRSVWPRIPLEAKALIGAQVLAGVKVDQTRRGRIIGGRQVERDRTGAVVHGGDGKRVGAGKICGVKQAR